MIKVDYLSNKLNEKNQLSLKKISIIACITTQLIFVGCAQQESPKVEIPVETPIEQPVETPVETPVEEPSIEDTYLNDIINIESFLRDDSYELEVNDEKRTVESLRKQYIGLYHAFVDYTDEEIEMMYDNLLKFAIKSNNFKIEQLKKSSTRMLSIAALGYYDYKNPLLIDIEWGKSAITDEHAKMVYAQGTPWQLGTLRHLFINPREGVSSSAEYFIDFEYREEKLNYQNYLEELSVDLETKRERVLQYMFYYEAYKMAAQEVGYELEFDPELKMIENPLENSTSYNKEMIKIKTRI